MASLGMIAWYRAKSSYLLHRHTTAIATVTVTTFWLLLMAFSATAIPLLQLPALLRKATTKSLVVLRAQTFCVPGVGSYVAKDTLL